MKGWAAFISSVLQTAPDIAPPQGRAMAAGVLSPADRAFVQAQGAALQNGLIFLEEKQFAGKKWARHGGAGDALTVDEFKQLPVLLSQIDSRAGAIKLWDSKENNLIYLIPTGDRQGRLYKIPIRFNRNEYGGMAIDDITSVFKIREKDINAMLGQREIRQIP